MSTKILKYFAYIGVNKMTGKEAENIMLTDEERKYLYLCFKSFQTNSISTTKKENSKEKVLEKLINIFSKG